LMGRVGQAWAEAGLTIKGDAARHTAAAAIQFLRFMGYFLM